MQAPFAKKTDLSGVWHSCSWSTGEFLWNELSREENEKMVFPRFLLTIPCLRVAGFLIANINLSTKSTWSTDCDTSNLSWADIISVK